MTFKQTLSAARHALRPHVIQAEPPERHALSADPYMCASVLQIALHAEQTSLALSAASTLVTFDPDRLWRALLTSVVEDHAGSETRLGLTILAAKLDPVWRKRAGGEWKVASFLVAKLAETPKSTAFRDLGRAARQFATLTNSPSHNSLRGNGLRRENAAVVDGVQQLSQLLLAADQERTGPYRRSLSELLERFSDSIPWERIDLAAALWRQTSSDAGLACVQKVVDGLGLLPKVPPDPIAVLQRAMTARTPNGWAVYRKLLADNPELSARLRSMGVNAGRHAEIVGAINERLEEETLGREPLTDKRFDGLPIGRNEAEAVAAIIRAKADAISALRRPHLPPSALEKRAYNRTSSA